MIAPPLSPRYIVKPRDSNIFDVPERSTGKVITERFGHNTATSHAMELEAKATYLEIKTFGQVMHKWALRIGALLTAVVILCSHL